MASKIEKKAREAVVRARAAGRQWAALPVAERARRLGEASAVILAEADVLARVVTEETGKPLAESYSSEVLGVADLFGYWCKHGPAHLAPRKGLIPAMDLPGKKARVERVPRGVVACISPWNYPVAIPMRTIVPALLAGNAVVLKPSEYTPRCGVWLVERLRACLGPVVEVLEGDGAAGAALVKADPDLVVFTGSTITGKKVAVACAYRGIPCEQELGGKDCAVVLDDADIDRAAAGIAWGIVTNAGQNCAGIERVAVHGRVAEHFGQALIIALRRAAADVPGLVTAAQRDLVVGHIEAALSEGAIALTGGVPEGDGAVVPTLLTDVPRTCSAWREESFGPVAVMAAGAHDDDLVEIANDSSFGLGASVWSKNIRRAERVAAKLESGMVWINNHSFTGALPDLPWVGTGASGGGITNSPEALIRMTRPRLVVVDTSGGLEPWWYPYSGKMLDLMKAAVERQRVGGVGSTLETLKALRARKRELR
jgi:acyl-CoA reductase-like NAD-dependent aldehyde dehydrogenase